MNPFQGQYPNIAVRITTTPTNPRIHRRNPETKIAEISKITPRMDRKSASPLPTFFVFVMDSIFASVISSAIDEKNPFLFQK
jgi:hypothetical protein